MTEFVTTELYLAAYFLAKGKKLVRVDKSMDSSRCFFVFDDPLVAKFIAKEYWADEGSIVPKKYAEAIRDLKERIFSGVQVINF